LKEVYDEVFCVLSADFCECDDQLHIWAGSAAEAIEHIEKNGVGYHNGPVFAHRIVAVEKDCEMEGEAKENSLAA
jgi:hypothetical protein